MSRTSAGIKIRESRREYAEGNYTLIYTDQPDFNLATPEKAEDLAERLNSAWHDARYMVELVIWVDDMSVEVPEGQPQPKKTQPFWYQLEKIRGFGDR